MDLAWWTPAHTNEILNIAIIVILVWGVRRILYQMKQLQNEISKLVK